MPRRRRSDRVVLARPADCSREKPCARLSRLRKAAQLKIVHANFATKGEDRGRVTTDRHLIVSDHGLGAAQAALYFGDIDRTGETRHLTEEKQGGASPEPEATAPDTEQAQRSAAAVAVADEPAIAEQGPDDTEETPATASTATEGTATAVKSAGDAEASASTEAPGESTAADIESPLDRTESVTAVAEADDAAAPATATEAPAEAPEAQTGALPGAPDAETQSTDALSDQDTVDAPAAGEDDEPEPVRDLGPEPTTMEELLAEQDSDIKSFKHGDVVEGSVVRIDKDEILVDIGAKSEGVVSNRELYGRHAENQPQLAIGDVVLVYVLQPESQEGHAVLSLRRAGLERKWRSMQEQFEAGVIIEAPVIDHNKGGLIVDCGIRGFVPISQIVDFPRRPQNDQPRDAAQEIAEKLMPFVGRKLRLKILEVNRKANRLILSEKVALYEERREKRDELFSSLQVGQKVTGTVRSIAPFGVFIDLGGIDGLVHKSELSWNKVNNPESGYKVGEEVEAEVIDINHERGRISLSIRRLQPDPWHSTVADFNVGDVIDGTVTKLVNFGAFVRVRDGLEGLIHISELSHQRVAHPGDVVHEGQALKLKIISLDSERHRLGLSLKQAEEPPARPAVESGQPSQASPAGAAAGPRPERRPRPERGYSMSDAVQEPEGGIDNTLAAAFAQVRDQLAASEEARSGSSTGDEAEATVAPDDVPVAEAGSESATAPGGSEPAASAEAEPAAATTTRKSKAAPTGDADATEAVAAEATPAEDAGVTATESAEPTGTADTDATTAGAAPAAEVAPEAEAADVVPPPEAEPEAIAPTEAEAAPAEADPAEAAAPDADVAEPEAEAAPATEEPETTDAPTATSDTEPGDADATATPAEEPRSAKDAKEKPSAS
jgi:small subunit ribosomal protein S1